MTGRGDGDRPLDRRPGGDYDVGYGKPPKHSRFRKGRSGNPRGRPKGARNKPAPASAEGLSAIILEEAYRTIQVRDGERTVPVPMAQAVMRSLAVNAAKGQQRAQRLFTDLVAATELENQRRRDALLEAVIAYKRAWEIEFERRAALGISGPEPVPHPDHIHIDRCTGAVTIRGPLTREDKADWDRWRQRRADFEEERVELGRMLKKTTDEQIREFIRSDMAHTERMLQIIRQVIPD